MMRLDDDPVKAFIALLFAFALFSVVIALTMSLTGCTSLNVGPHWPYDENEGSVVVYTNGTPVPDPEY